MACRLVKPSALAVKKLFKNPVLVKQSNQLCTNISAPRSSSHLGNVIKQKLNQLVQWYEETTGMDEVRMAQKRVLDAEERFISAQDRRRDTNKEVNVIQGKLKDLYAELDNTSRGEERYVALITEEHKLLKQERQIMDEFKRYEREEREHFSALSSAVKESHEKERAQAERTKYWSIIGSILGTVIGIIGSSINNEIKMKELRKLLRESTITSRPENLSTIPEVLSRQENKFNTIADEVNASLKQNNNIANRLNNVIGVLDNTIKSDKLNSKTVVDAMTQQQIAVDKSLQEIKLILTSLDRDFDKDNITQHFFDKSYSLTDRDKTAKLIFLGSIIVILPIVFSYFGMYS